MINNAFRLFRIFSPISADYTGLCSFLCAWFYGKSNFCGGTKYDTGMFSVSKQVFVTFKEEVSGINLHFLITHVPSVLSWWLCSNSRSSVRTLCVYSFLALSIPLSFTGNRSVWGGLYATGQQCSLRVSQHKSGSSSITLRKTLRGRDDDKSKSVQETLRLGHTSQ